MLTALVVSAFMMCCALVAQGSANRTYVSSTGSDGNSVSDCQQTAPCRTFQTAIGQTNAGGQVIALDSTGYSGFSVNKSITIQGAPGQIAFIFVGAGFSGITVTGVSTDLVVLRNIYVDGLGGGSTTGLTFTGAARLIVENCTFKSSTTGISVSGTGGSKAKMDLINSDVNGNTTGISASGQGTDRSPSGNAASTTMVRINGGNIIGNGTAFFQTNPGVSLSNILLLQVANAGNASLTNIMGNTTVGLQSGTGTGCPAGVCTFPLLYFGMENIP